MDMYEVYAECYKAGSANEGSARLLMTAMVLLHKQAEYAALSPEEMFQIIREGAQKLYPTSEEKDGDGLKEVKDE